MATLSVLSLRLVATGTDGIDAWLQHAQKQWGGKVSVHVSTAGAQVLGTTPPKLVDGTTYRINWEDTLVVPVDSESWPLLLKVVGHQQGPGTVLGFATFNLAAFFSSGARYSRQALHVFPSASLTATTVHAVVEVGIAAEGATPIDAAGPGRQLEQAPPLTTSIAALADDERARRHRRGSRMSGAGLDFTFGTVQASLTDMYFPTFLAEAASTVNGNNATSRYTVSNVLAVMNASPTERIWVTLQSRRAAEKGPLRLAVNPSSGLVVGPGQRAFFSVTWVPQSHLPPGSPTESPAGAAALAGDPALALCVADAETGDARPVVTIAVHTQCPTDERLLAPYHYWVNDVCVTNRPATAAETPYIRSVLPAPGTIPTSDGLVPQSPLTPGVGAATFAPTVRSRDSGAMVPVAGDGVAQCSPSPERVLVGLDRKACLCTLVVGRIHGLPPPRVGFPATASRFRLTLAPGRHWGVDHLETAEVQQAPDGSVTFPDPIRINKGSRAWPHHCLRLTLTEVSSVDPADSVPAAVAVVTLWPLSSTPAKRRLPLSFLALGSYSRYDDLEHTGLAVHGGSIAFSSIQ